MLPVAWGIIDLREKDSFHLTAIELLQCIKLVVKSTTENTRGGIVVEITVRKSSEEISESTPIVTLV